MESKQQNAKRINKLVGISEHGDIVYIHEHHWNGVSVNYFHHLTGEDVSERNDLDNVKETYSYLWQEAAADGNTELGLDEWLEDLIESETVYGGSYFLGQDDSYTNHITSNDVELLEEYLETSIECFECVGGGTGYMSDIKFMHVFDQKVLDEAIKHERSINKQKPVKLTLV